MILICRVMELKDFPAETKLAEMETKHLPWDLTTIIEAELAAVICGPLVVMVKELDTTGRQRKGPSRITTMVYFQELLAQRIM